MFSVLSFIRSVFPTECLSNFSDTVDEAGVDIRHPSNKEMYLSIVVLPDRVGVALIKESEQGLILDLGGFDYTFELCEKRKLHNALLHFYETGFFKSE